MMISFSLIIHIVLTFSVLSVLRFNFDIKHVYIPIYISRARALFICCNVNINSLEDIN